MGIIARNKSIYSSWCVLGFTEVLLLFFLAHDKLKGLLALVAISQTSKNCQSLKI